ncbi:Binuclear zinc transcription factor [Tolypocladium capitatum]|uniref:Binuclear zinc transcription factor n=1 Tax=Tolypocladium capitatum TaxID=45235 RepID=A0A2K3QB21_9HYPO|nr:Binuclear zinc transcription factor [Tolypocladium capitatum]
MPPHDRVHPDPSAAGTEPLACVSCRSRKLRCDRTKPACARCLRVGGECVYPESKRKPTFRRRNVEALEARLAQVEDYLSHVNKGDAGSDSPGKPPGDPALRRRDFTFETGPPAQDSEAPGTAGHSEDSPDLPNFASHQSSNYGGDGQLMGLGYSETVPPPGVQEELNNYFFLVHHHFIPVIHSGLYYQAFYGGPLRKPPICLQYAVWAMAANGHSKYHQYAEVFYQRARQYAEADEMKAGCPAVSRGHDLALTLEQGHGEHFITLAHAQTWVLVAAYEARCMLYTRASMNCAKCVRLTQMMGLDRLDGGQDDLPPVLGPATTWAELEERRRVLWGAFAIDSHASISTGWPCLIDPDNIITRLPASEEAFSSGQQETAPFMDEVFKGASYGGFASAIVICQVFRCILQHVHRTKPTDNADDMMEGAFWKRHRDLDNKLSSTFMFLPEKLRLPQNVRDPAAIHTNLNLHAAVITLHHAAAEQQEKHGLPESVKQTSICRLRTSAEEIANIMKMTSHSTVTFKSPLCALSLYCATTVYVYLAKDNPVAGLTALDTSNLEHIINAMEAIGRQHEITCAFLQQACLDVERNGLDSCIRLPTLTKYRDIFGGPNSNIPLLARSSVSKHTEMSSILPGRLPLQNPEGNISPRPLKVDSGDPPHLVTGGTHSVVEGLINSDCFQSVLGAVTRNVAPRPTDNPSHKRKRMSPSPGPEAARSMAMLNAVMEDLTKDPTNMANPLGETPDPGLGPGMLRFGGGVGVGAPSPGASGLFVLPDRTSSSASSPANRERGTDGLSGSSRTSPGTVPGNTPEENRFDLRPPQDRIVTSSWQSTEDALFGAQIPQSMVNLTPGDDGAWALLTETMGWQ